MGIKNPPALKAGGFFLEAHLLNQKKGHRTTSNPSLYDNILIN